MATNAATPTHLGPEFYPQCDPVTLRVTPRKREDFETGDSAKDTWALYSTIEAFRSWLRKYFVVTGDFTNTTLSIQARQEIAYVAQKAGRGYEGLPSYDEYVGLINEFNKALESPKRNAKGERQLVLRDRDNRPEAPAPTSTIATLPALTPGSVTLDDVVLAVNATTVNFNALTAMLIADRRRQTEPGPVKRGLKRFFTPQGEHR